MSERLSVSHVPDVVWRVLSDPREVVGCIDGSELGESHDDGSFDARLAIRFAAIRLTFGARATLELDHEARSGRLSAHGMDSRGSTRVAGLVDYRVVTDDAGCTVQIEGEIDIKGPLASMVTTGATVVIERMTRTFAEQLARRCAELDPESAPKTSARKDVTVRAWLAGLVSALRAAADRRRGLQRARQNDPVGE